MLLRNCSKWFKTLLILCLSYIVHSQVQPGEEQPGLEIHRVEAGDQVYREPESVPVDRLDDIPTQDAVVQDVNIVKQTELDTEVIGTETDSIGEDVPSSDLGTSEGELHDFDLDEYAIVVEPPQTEPEKQGDVVDDLHTPHLESEQEVDNQNEPDVESDQMVDGVNTPDVETHQATDDSVDKVIEPLQDSPETVEPFQVDKEYTLEELYAFHEKQLFPAASNALGYRLLFSGKPAESFPIFKNLAEVYGLPDAQHALAFQYINGFGVEQSLSKSLIYQTFSSLGENEASRQALAFQYLTGTGVTKDCEKALVYYQAVAQNVIDEYQKEGLTTLTNRHNSDLHRYQIKLYEYNDPTMETAGDDSQEEQALEWIKYRSMKAITEPEQLLVIGQLYLNGIQVQRDLKKAEESFKKVGDSPLALAYLGKIYLEGGDGIEVDYVKAKEYIEKAVARGSSVGRATLGFMHLNGLGVKQDILLAQENFEQSAKQGWFEGAVHLGKMYLDGTVTTNNKMKDYQQALKYFGIASQQRNIIAMFYMGKMHSRGLGASRSCQTSVGYYKEVVEQGSNQSIKLWKKAFENYKAGNKESALIYYSYLGDLGFEIAQVNVAQMIKDREIENFDNINGESWRNRAKFNWQRAADQSGSTASTATLNLGDYFYYEEHDYEKAIVQYRSAGDTHNHPQALFNLAYMHQYGEGLNQDLHLAKRYFDRAMEVDQDAAIAVCLSLIKLGFDTFLTRFTSVKAEDDVMADSAETSEGEEALSIETMLNSLLGDSWDVIIMTLLALFLGFVWAYRRQTRMLYNQQRLREIMRLEELQNQSSLARATEINDESIDEQTVLVEKTDVITTNKSTERLQPIDNNEDSNKQNQVKEEESNS